MSWEERVDSRRIGPCEAGNRITWYQEGFYRIILSKEERAFRESFEISFISPPLTTRNFQTPLSSSLFSQSKYRPVVKDKTEGYLALICLRG